MHHQDSKRPSLYGAFRHNVVIYMHNSVLVVLMSNTIHDREDVSSISPIAHFSLPDLILHARHICACFELPVVWFLSLHKENELLDSVAKEAQNDAINTNFKIPYTDIKEHINIYVVKIEMKITTHLSTNVSACAPCTRLIFLTGKNMVALSKLILQIVVFSRWQVRKTTESEDAHANEGRLKRT